MLLYVLLASFVTLAFCFPASSNMDNADQSHQGPNNSGGDTAVPREPPKKYVGHKVLRCIPRNNAQVEFLRSLVDDTDLPLDFWLYPGIPGRPVDVRVPPEVFDDVMQLLHDHGIDPTITINNVQKLVDQERLWNNMNTEDNRRRFIRSTNSSDSDKSNSDDGAWQAVEQEDPLLQYNPIYQVRHSDTKESFRLDRYNSLEDIERIKRLISESWSSLASIHNIGTSSEGRPLDVVKITGPVQEGSANSSKPMIWLTGGMHGREWISPAVVLYFIAALVLNYNVDPDIKLIVDHYEWYILPVANPDGYSYTMTDAAWGGDRMWRKTRSVREANGKTCIGVDPNRNWDIHWGERGASHHPCSIVYAGPSAFSEPEVASQAAFLEPNAGRVKIAIDFHSNGQIWMTPYAYSKKYPVDFDDMYLMALDATDELWNVNKTVYFVGSVANIMYRASGSGIDWMHDLVGVKYAYGVELPGEGYSDFFLAPDRIIPVSVETFHALKYIAKEVINEI